MVVFPDERLSFRSIEVNKLLVNNDTEQVRYSIASHLTHQMTQSLAMRHPRG